MQIFCNSWYKTWENYKPHQWKTLPVIKSKRTWARGYREVSRIWFINNPQATNERLTFLTSVLQQTPFITLPGPTSAQCPRVLERQTWLGSMALRERIAETITAPPSHLNPPPPLPPPPHCFCSGSNRMTATVYLKMSTCFQQVELLCSAANGKKMETLIQQRCLKLRNAPCSY